ncbi:nitrilase [Histoplasma capsulatum]|uniref:Nitrilase n=1 Tax=Ajellomyces capsulatus TaxID=5037 RepID=A0A8A1MNP5_AJECA|nr:predicted protein [Histoplasma mississippiense (nom. inval.)]EDN09972.1 predicted protein [Histoplasma mississippiense (nom. inval.)]QSS66354.1 nitrilase [Histoplasma capsulatum]
MEKQSRRPHAKGKAPVRGPGRPTRAGLASRSRSGRGRGQEPERATPEALSEVPLVYRDMLAEAGAGATGTSGQSGSLVRPGDDRPVKRRRVGEKRAGGVEAVTGRGDVEGGGVAAGASKPVQTVFNADASDDESEMEWEDVEVALFTPLSGSASGPGHDGTTEQRDVEQQQKEAGVGGSEESLQITLERPAEKGKQRASAVRRKPVTGQEKRWRLDIHKMHILCLLVHVQLRNMWCNDNEVQNVLKRLLSKHTTMCLNPKETLPQFTRSTTFADGLKQASETFRRRFKATVPGMKRPYWLEDSNELKDPTDLLDSAEILSSREDFLHQAVTLQGSRDLGAQLFCALLRAVGVDVRLVCSLQVLPFTGVAKGFMPLKREQEYIVLSEDDGSPSSIDVGQSSPATGGTAKAHDTPAPSRTRRIGQPRFTSSPALTPKPRPSTALPRAFAESPFPIFWVEVFNEAMQKWVPVDPVVTNTVGKPSKFEPPASDRYNNMSYVVAFEDDMSARDVTKRYTKSFNSKTRKQRVESTKDGEEWWARTMAFFEKPFPDDRDQVEIGELTAKAAAEMMPRNVQDFKDHPVYALERHLRRNEVIYPKREIGKVGLSKISPSKKNPPLESVYRRGDVHLVKSADGWYRNGREVKVGEQPLKRVRVLRSTGRGIGHREELSDYEEEAQEIPMYSIHQTDLYKPPPVVENRVTKNVYGNIDVYTPSMVPEGGFHLRHTEAAAAARVLGIDYADAVTGFQFKGRHGTAVVQGIVASVEYREALYAVLDALDDERVQAEHEKRSAEALAMWKLLLLKLRVAERVRSYAFEGEGDEEDEDKEGEMVPDDDGNIEGGGGFIRESGQADVVPLQEGFSDFDSPLEAGGFLPEGIKGEENHSTLNGGFLQSSTVPDEPGPSRPATGLGSTSLRSKGRSRYTLIVTKAKNDTSSTSNQQQPMHNQPTSVEPCVSQLDISPTATPLRTHIAWQPQGQQSSTAQLQQQEQHLTATATAGSPTAHIAFSSAGSDQCSVEEICRVPDLVHEGESDSEIDQSSMLSHDPEDEDAEPEWLLSD